MTAESSRALREVTVLMWPLILCVPLLIVTGITASWVWAIATLTVAGLGVPWALLVLFGARRDR